MTVYALGYHEVVEDARGALLPLGPQSSRYLLERRVFRAHLESIRLRAPDARVATVEAWNTQPSVFLTFDDGTSGSYECAADELERIGWRGHFFIITGLMGRRGFMSGQQIRELRRRGHIVGSHTHSHPARMSSLTRDELRDEWRISCSMLSDVLGEQVTTASVANGYYSPRVGRSAAASGIRVLFNSEPVSTVSMVEECRILGRYSIVATMSAQTSGAIAAGGLWPRWRQRVTWEVKRAVKASANEHYLSLRRLLLAHSRPDRPNGKSEFRSRFLL